MTNISKVLEESDGFCTDLQFNANELELVRTLIRSQWLKRIDEFERGLSQKFEKIEMSQYHHFAHLVDHASLWPKSKRILNSSDVMLIRNTSFFRCLENHFGQFRISGEDGIEPEEMYWRLVRPNNSNDVGPLHADEWFWSLGHGLTPKGFKRVKVWISIYSEAGKNGFGFVRGSHKKNWRYHGVLRDGISKPQIDEDVESLSLEIFEANPGQAIIFHDKLLHCGVVGGSTTRVSLEFTMFVREVF